VGRRNRADGWAGGDHRRRSPARRAANALLLAFVAVALAPVAAHAALYKWVDDKGVVHYTDQVPPEAVNKGNVQLSPQGVPIRKVDPAIAPEQRKARETARQQEDAARRETAKQQEETTRRDRALLDSYTTESDIDLAKSRALRTIQAALDSAQGYSAQLAKRRAALTEKKPAAAGQPGSADLEREVSVIDAEIARQRDVIVQKNKQLIAVAARYDGDKERWQALKGTPQAANGAPAAGSAPAPAPVAAPPSTK